MATTNESKLGYSSSDVVSDESVARISYLAVDMQGRYYNRTYRVQMTRDDKRQIQSQKAQTQRKQKAQLLSHAAVVNISEKKSLSRNTKDVKTRLRSEEMTVVARTLKSVRSNDLQTRRTLIRKTINHLKEKGVLRYGKHYPVFDDYAERDIHLIFTKKGIRRVYEGPQGQIQHLSTKNLRTIQEEPVRERGQVIEMEAQMFSVWKGKEKEKPIEENKMSFADNSQTGKERRFFGFEVSASPAIESSLDKISEAMSKVADVAKSIKTGASDMATAVQSICQIFTPMGLAMTAVGLFAIGSSIYCVIQAFRTREYSWWYKVFNVALAATAVVCGGSLLYGVLQRMAQEILAPLVVAAPGSSGVRETIPKDPNAPVDMVSQGGITRDTFNRLTTGVACAMSVLMVSRTPSQRKLKALTDAVGSFSRLQEGSEAIGEVVVQMVTDATNWVRDHVLGLSKVQLLQTKFPECKQWLEEVERWLSRRALPAGHPDALQYTTTTYEALMSLRHRGTNIIATSPVSKKSQAMRDMMACVLRDLDNLLGAIEQNGISRKGMRIRPYAIHFWGESGVGKSNILIPFSNHLLAWTVAKEDLPRLASDPGSFRFEQADESSYCEGYMHQPCWILDDVGQKKEVPGMFNPPSMALIRMLNEALAPCDMARLDLKGTVYHRETLVLMSGNTKNIECGAIHMAEAILRRIDLSVEVTVKEKFSKPYDGPDHKVGIKARRLDPELVGPETRFDIYEFYVHRGSEKPRCMEWDELCAFALREYRERLRTGDLKIRKVQQHLENVIANRNLAEAHDARELELHPEMFGGMTDTKEEKKKKHLMPGEAVHVGAPPQDTRTFSQAMSVLPAELQKMIIEFSKTSDLSDPQIVFVASRMSDWLREFRGIPPMDIVEAKIKGLILTVKRDKPKQICMPDVSLEDRARLRGWLMEGMCRVQSWYEENKVLIWIFGLVTTILTVGGLAWAVTSWLSTPNMTVEAANSGGAEHKHVRVPTQPKKKTVIPMGAEATVDGAFLLEPQGGHDQTGYNVAVSIMRKNCWQVLDGDRVIGNLIAVAGNTFLGPLHYCTMWETKIKKGQATPNDLLRLRSPVCDYTLEIPVSSFLKPIQDKESAASDYALYQISAFTFMRPNIMHFFAVRGKVEKERDWIGLRPTFGTQGEVIIENVELSTDRKARYDDGSGNKKTIAGWHFNGANDLGWCGYPLLLRDRALQAARIVGLHTAGVPGKGLCFCVPVYFEDIQRLMDMVDDTVPQMATGYDIHISAPMPKHVLGGRFCEIAELPHGRTVGVSRNTELKRSKLEREDWSPAFQAPAVLKPGVPVGGEEVIDPFREAIKRYCTPGEDRPYIEYGEIKMACVAQIAFMNKAVSKAEAFPRRKLSDDENFNGVPGLMRPIDRGTAMGSPYDESPPPRPGRGKHPWLGNGPRVDLNDQVVLSLINTAQENVTMILKGIRPPFKFKDFMKDELRSQKKVDAMQTRLISGSPFDLLFLFRRYFGAFMIHAYQGRGRNGFAGGLDAMSGDWDTLGKVFRNYQGLLAGDWKDFDIRMNPMAPHVIAEVVNMWYRNGPDWCEDDDKVRRALIQCVVNSWHIFENWVYEWFAGFPSGTPFTSLLDGLWNWIIFRIIFFRVHGRSPWAWKEFDNHCWGVVMGDDHVIGVSAVASVKFNMLTIAHEAAQMGLIYTDADKEAPKDKLIPLEKAKFLKRAWRWDDQLAVYVAPLELRTLIDMPFWTLKGSSERMNTRERLGIAVRELSLHGEEVFNKYVPLLCGAYDKAYGEMYPAQSYEGERDLCLDADFII